MSGAATGSPRTRWLAIAAILCACLVAYLPALDAGWIWDDDSYVLENPAVRTADGFVDAWIPGRTPQWYPMVFVSLWAQHAVHGIEPFGYHLVNLLLHLISTVMVWRLLAALRVPGAAAAAALFALHPLQVESVAWVTERKNVLSMAFSLAAMLAWVRFLRAEPGSGARARWWGAAMLLFVLALLSKTTAVAVPVAMAAVAWWGRGRGGDDAGKGAPAARVPVAAVLPFFVVGAGMGAVTAWLEATHVGARGAEFVRGPMERILHAAQAWWAYLAMWTWPADLVFVHPPFAGGEWRAWTALGAGCAVAVAAVLAARRGHRWAMVAFLTYSAGVFPALGFVNLYPLRYAPVADHFAYVATVTLAACSGAALADAWRRLVARGIRPALAAAPLVVVCAALGALTWGQASTYRDEETLWRATLERNPRAWLAANNMVSILLRRVEAATDAGDAAARDAALAEASALSESAADLAGGIDMPVLSNLSEVRRLQGRLPESLAALDAAIGVQPSAPGPHWQRGRVLELLGRFADAGPEYAAAVNLSPRQPVYLREQVRWLTKAGRIPEARAVAERIAALDPGDPEAAANLGALALEQGDVTAARRILRAALANAEGEIAPIVATRTVMALLQPPLDPVSTADAAEIAGRLVRLTEGRDPVAIVLLARAQAAGGAFDAARANLRRADDLLAGAPAEVREALAPERAAVEALLAAPSAGDAPAR